MSLWLSAWSGVRALGQLLTARAESLPLRALLYSSFLLSDLGLWPCSPRQVRGYMRSPAFSGQWPSSVSASVERLL